MGFDLVIQALLAWKVRKTKSVRIRAFFLITYIILLCTPPIYFFLPTLWKLLNPFYFDFEFDADGRGVFCPAVLPT